MTRGASLPHFAIGIEGRGWRQPGAAPSLIEDDHEHCAGIDVSRRTNRASAIVDGPDSQDRGGSHAREPEALNGLLLAQPFTLSRGAMTEFGG